MSLEERFSNERAWRKGGRVGIPDGVDTERAIFGATILSPKEGREYLSFSDAIAFAKEHQPSTLTRSRLVTQLRKSIAESLSDSTLPLKFFTAVGTPLDTYHGVDGFFEQGNHIVTCDISLREKEVIKADVLIFVTMDREGRVSISETEMKRVVEKIVRNFDNRAQRKSA